LCTQGIDPDLVGLHRMSDDALGPTTVYGKHLLQMGESQELLILMVSHVSQTLASSLAGHMVGVRV
jgi:hypothetical protein